MRQDEASEEKITQTQGARCASASSYVTLRVKICICECRSPTTSMRPLSSRYRIASRASDAFTLRRSETVAGVMSFAFGISFTSLSTVALSHMTLFINFSLTLPLDHFFLPFLPPAAAAAAFCSLDFCALGAIAPRLPCHLSQ